MQVILLHGYQVLDGLFLPIGMLSEEAQEANNKKFKRFREKFSRKTSRIGTNTERLLPFSDPYLSSIEELPKKTNEFLTDDMIRLLSLDNDHYDKNDDDDDDNDDDNNNSEHHDSSSNEDNC